MGEINPKMFAGEPVCSGENCPRYGECDWPHNAPPVGDPCVPWLRQQLEALRQELKDTRMTARWFKREANQLKCCGNCNKYPYGKEEVLCPRPGQCAGSDSEWVDECWERWENGK